MMIWCLCPFQHYLSHTETKEEWQWNVLYNEAPYSHELTSATSRTQTPPSGRFFETWNITTLICVMSGIFFNYAETNGCLGCFLGWRFSCFPVPGVLAHLPLVAHGLFLDHGSYLGHTRQFELTYQINARLPKNNSISDKPLILVYSRSPSRWFTWNVKPIFFSQKKKKKSMSFITVLRGTLGLTPVIMNKLRCHTHF